MSTSSDGHDNNVNNGDYTRVNWNPPGTDRGDSVSTKNATLALKTAIAVARAFDANCALRNPAKECTIPMFEPQELVLGEPLRSSGFFTDLALRGIKLTRNLQHGEFSDEEEEFRERFAERSIDGHYAVKFLQKGIYNSVHSASAASDMMMETKILMNLAPHPNIVNIDGVTAAGSDAFLSRGKDGFYIILDRLSETMVQRLNQWRHDKNDNDQYTKLMQRLEVALDIASALLFLSDRQIVFHVRPDKVGFDVRYGRIKLCEFGQARENGQLDQAPSLTKTDDIRTLAYTAPEVLCQAPVTVAADVYAYGVVLWEMLSLQRPFEGLSRAEHFERVIMEGERPPIAAMIPKQVQSLIEKCWDPHLRPTMKKVYDTVEEVLLFQDDKPVLKTTTNRPTTTSDDVLMDRSHQEAQQSTTTRTKRPLRRTKTEEGTFGGKTRPDRAQRRATRSNKAEQQQQGSSAHADGRGKSSNHESGGGGRTSRRSRNKSSSHDRQHKSSNHETMKDRSGKSIVDETTTMRDESRDSHGSATPMKDRSSKNHQRQSRRSRAASKKSSSTTTTEAAVATAETEAKIPTEISAVAKDDETAVGGKTTTKPSMPTIPANEATEAAAAAPRKLTRSRSSENVAAAQQQQRASGGSNSGSGAPSSSTKGPAFGRSQTSTGARRSRR